MLRTQAVCIPGICPRGAQCSKLKYHCRATWCACAHQPQLNTGASCTGAKDPSLLFFFFLHLNRNQPNFIMPSLNSTAASESKSQEIESKIIMRYLGYESSSFPISRSMCQGCPLSPLLFILVQEPLAAHIRLNQNIAAIELKGIPHKIDYVRDWYPFICCLTSYCSTQFSFFTVEFCHPLRFVC